MTKAAIRKVASRAAANLVAVAAISAIFGLKAFIDAQAKEIFTDDPASSLYAASAYDPYLTEQP
ncbi:MAG: hypothetical protein AB7P23_03730 [Amphiplicatus sp.]